MTIQMVNILWVKASALFCVHLRYAITLDTSAEDILLYACADDVLLSYLQYTGVVSTWGLHSNISVKSENLI